MNHNLRIVKKGTWPEMSFGTFGKFQTCLRNNVVGFRVLTFKKDGFKWLNLVLTYHKIVKVLFIDHMCHIIVTIIV